VAEYFKGFFSWLTTLCQPVPGQRGRKWLNFPLMALHSLWTSRRKAYIQPWTDNGGKNNYRNPGRLPPQIADVPVLRELPPLDDS